MRAIALFNRQSSRAIGTAVLLGSAGGLVANGTASATSSATARSASTPRAYIQSIRFVQRPQHSKTTRTINKFALPQLRQEAIYSNGAHVHTVTGATYTTRAFRHTLHYALLRIANADANKTVTTQTVEVRYDAHTRGGGDAGPLQLKVTGHRYNSDPTPQPTYTGGPYPSPTPVPGRRS